MFTWAGCVIDRAVFAATAGALLDLTLEIEGIDRI